MSDRGNSLRIADQAYDFDSGAETPFIYSSFDAALKRRSTQIPVVQTFPDFRDLKSHLLSRGSADLGFQLFPAGIQLIHELLRALQFSLRFQQSLSIT